MRRDVDDDFVTEIFERNLNSWAQLWRMQIGIRYSF